MLIWEDFHIVGAQHSTEVAFTLQTLLASVYTVIFSILKKIEEV